MKAASVAGKQVSNAKVGRWSRTGLCRTTTRELRPFTHYIPDLPRLSAHKDRIVLAGGQDSRKLLSGQTAYRPAALLAERFGTQVVDFPGDHVGYASQPAAFAAKLREVLG